MTCSVSASRRPVKNLTISTFPVGFVCVYLLKLAFMQTSQMDTHTHLFVIMTLCMVKSASQLHAWTHTQRVHNCFVLMTCMVKSVSQPRVDLSKKPHARSHSGWDVWLPPQIGPVCMYVCMYASMHSPVMIGKCGFPRK
jgi:hypothetical protein